jgi:uncharacterized integral membrane protein
VLAFGKLFCSSDEAVSANETRRHFYFCLLSILLLLLLLLLLRSNPFSVLSKTTLIDVDVVV